MLTKEDLTIEFRQGDEIPLKFSAGGDLIEITEPVVNYVSVKRDFWLRIRSDKFEFSLDGRTYKAVTDSLRGTLSLGADKSGNFNVGLETFLK